MVWLTSYYLWFWKYEGLNKENVNKMTIDSLLEKRTENKEIIISLCSVEKRM